MLSCNSTSINFNIGQAAILIGSQRDPLAAVAHRLAENFKGATVEQLTFPAESKRCAGPCREVKPLSAFHLACGSLDGHGRCCKECENARGRIKHARLPERHIWRCMIKRCHDAKSSTYQGYGSRGIKVCGEWRGAGGFERFLAHVGRRPSPLHSIDRFPNNDGNYEPGNVRWATDEEQNRNRGDYNTLLSLGDITQTIAAWSDSTGFSSAAICNRIYVLGWTVERALTEPIRSNAKPRLITFQNRTMPLSRWAKELGIKRNTLDARLAATKDVEEAFAIPNPVQRGTRKQ